MSNGGITAPADNQKMFWIIVFIVIVVVLGFKSYLVFFR